jgi:Tfp pilus assembly protein PilF
LRALTGDDERRAKQLDEQIYKAMKEDHWNEAIAKAEELLALRSQVQGAGHFEAVDADWRVKALRRVAGSTQGERAAFLSATDMNEQAESLYEKGKYAEAHPLLEKALAIRRRLLGEDHPETATSHSNLAGNLDMQGKCVEAEPLHRQALATYLRALGKDHKDTAGSYNNLAVNLDMQGKHVEAEPLHRQALAIRLKAMGEGHPDNATIYNNLGINLDGQGRYAEAELLFRKALAIHIKALGEGHRDTARSYQNLAQNLDEQGRYAEAESLQRKALAIRLKALGEGHRDTAASYHNLALNLIHQGKYSEAESLQRKALAIRLEALGEDHPSTADSYNNLGINLDEQGRYAEAGLLFRQALVIRLKALGEDHPDTATIYNNVAYNLDAQGKYAEAEPLSRRALAIRLKALGEGHPETAFSYRDLAANLIHQGKYSEAESLQRKALALWVKALGEGHPETAGSYSYLARNLDAQGKHIEAEPLLRTALAVDLKALGEGHPAAASSYNDLAANLDAQGKLVEAVANWTAAAAIYEGSRGARGASGFERSLTGASSPLPALATALARRGDLRDAWARWESDLARGLLDDLSARLLRPLTRAERSREADLAGQLQRLDERSTRLAAKARRTQDEDKQLGALCHQQSALRSQWVEFQNALDREYQAYAGKPATLEEVQKALPTDGALLGWLDVAKHHWACVVRHEGDPAWVQIPGSGEGRAWTKEDDGYPGRLREALAAHQPDWRGLAAALARRRLAPLLPHLKGVKHLIVLPSPALAGVPIETLVAGAPHAGATDLVVSYAPSGSMFARLTVPRSQALEPPRLLALGDPAFPKRASSGPAPTPPDHGIPILAVVPHGTADLFGIKPGDVLLEYNGKVLKTMSDLAIVPAGDKATRVPVKLWRGGEIRSLEIAVGRLGIQSHPNRPAAQVVLARRAAAEVLTPSVRGGSLTPLPGTRREVQAIAALFASDQVTTLLGPEATESNLQRLAQSGTLKGYRFLHLATHGLANPSVALGSAVFLAAEPDRPAASADPAALESAPDGQVTAEQIVRTWELDADLVVLSACESGLGRHAGGEGYLGFAQALFVKGAHSLVLSQWKVDDQATALLMTRFYRNLLGQQSGLSQPLPKADALDEAKRWLRELTVGEVDTARAALERGTVRPLVDGAAGPAPREASSAPQPAVVRPYAHPYYWASFILIGDPR